MSSKPYDVLDTLPDLDAGVFARKLSHALAETALAVVSQEGKSKKGKVTIEFDITRMSEAGNQVMVAHKVAFSRPTRRGKSAEDDTTETPMYVGGDGALTLLPFKQDDLFKAAAAPTVRAEA